MSTAIEKNDKTAIVPLPAHLQQYANEDKYRDQISMDDITIPRLGIAQDGLTPQLKKNNESYIPGLQAGDLFNTATRQIYGSKVTVVPLFHFKNWIHFKPMADGGGVVGQYQNERDVPPALAKWIDGKPPAVTEFKNRMCLIPGPEGKPELIVVSFKSTGIKASKEWTRSIANHKPAMPFVHFYDLEVIGKTKGQQSWYGLRALKGDYTPVELFNSAKTFFDQLQADGFKVDLTGAEDLAGDGTETEGGNTEF